MDYELPKDCPKCGQRLPWGDPVYKQDPLTGKEYLLFECKCRFKIERPCADAPK